MDHTVKKHLTSDFSAKKVMSSSPTMETSSAHLSLLRSPGWLRLLSQHICVDAVQADGVPWDRAEGIYSQGGQLEPQAPHVKGADNGPSLKQVRVIAYLQGQTAFHKSCAKCFTSQQRNEGNTCLQHPEAVLQIVSARQ